MSAPPAAGGLDVTGAVAREANLQADPKPAGDLVDLNTGSFDQLNSLDGGGPIGRAIIKGRPYASTEDLVRKKILKRSVFDHIKDQVTVR
jgi:DNA uptake protein ComE-like DNA-binding protein